jgi:uncharacterized membrane protein YeaQ/YmgE (transglycosylase-associated protein family)
VSKSTFDFNKEIVFGEIGALVSAPLTASIVSKYTSVNNIISASAVFGAILGASVFWLIMRIYDEKRNKIFSVKGLERDIVNFTPAAFLLTLLVYYPVLFLLSKHLLTEAYKLTFSVFISQLVAFSLFLISINIYRYMIRKYYGTQL